MKKIAVLLVVSLSLFFFFPIFLASNDEQQNNDAILNHLNILKEELLSYFLPITAKIVSVKDRNVQINIGKENGLKQGIRFQVFKKGKPFLHPITKEIIGTYEIPIGKIEVTIVDKTESTASIIEGESEKFIDADIKIPDLKQNLLFSQGNVDWILGNFYHRLLKESSKFELVDTTPSREDIEKLLNEGKRKNAEIALILSAEYTKDIVKLKQEIFWTDNKEPFSQKTIEINLDLISNLKKKADNLLINLDKLISITLPFGANIITSGDIDGDKNTEIIFASGNKLRGTRVQGDIKIIWEFSVPISEIIWLDTADVNNDGKDELLVTTYENENDRQKIISYIYEFKDNSFVPIYTLDYQFIRWLNKGILGQEYDEYDGYTGKVFKLFLEDGTIKKGDNVNLPSGVNIYDFQLFHQKSVVSFDEKGKLNLYDEKGLRVWQSSNTFGHFPLSFEKKSVLENINKGEWSVKTRLIPISQDILALKRNPVAKIMKSLGHSSSEVMKLSLNSKGISIDEEPLIEKISGKIIDYTLVEDKIFLISKPILGIDFKKLFKGEDPTTSTLYIFSIKDK